jgi:hypothetical protein
MLPARNCFTAKPRAGCGWDLDYVRQLLEKAGNERALQAWRQEVTPQRVNQHSAPHDNIIRHQQGTGKAYTLDRLKRDRPELFEQVCDGKLSANAAAIQAGFRKRPALDAVT